MPDATPQITALDEVYGKSLLEIAQADGSVDTLAEEAAALRELSEHEPDLMRLLGSQMLSDSERSECVDRLFSGKVSDLMLRFLKVVNDKGRLGRMPNILAAFERAVLVERGIVEVDAYVAAKMNKTQSDGVAARLGTALGKQVVLRQHIDPAVIGGIKLRIGDRLVDGSVATQLKLLKERMATTGREMAKTGAAIE